MLKLYGNLDSGNDYKVRLILSQLSIPFDYEHKDTYNGETRTPEFLAINPNGRIPALVMDDGQVLVESGAILYYFAQGTPMWPTDKFQQAQVLQWMFFEQYSHEPYVAVARSMLHQENGPERFKDQLPEKWEKGKAALNLMEQHLANRSFMVAEQYSIADIALYAYTHVAEEGEFDLSVYPNIRAWLDRVADQPGHILITQSEFD